MKAQSSKNTASSITSTLIAGLTSFIVFGAAHADVTTQERMSLAGEGMMKFANMHGTTTTTIAGDRARTDSDLTFESGLVRTFSGGAGQTTEIVRLDQDKIIDINNKKKTYTETTFAEKRAQMQEMMEKMQKSQGAQQQQTSGVDESECEWSDPKADVKRTGEKAMVGGYQSERVTIVATQSCRNKKKPAEVCDFGLVLDQWIAPGFEASKETIAYQQAYAERLGLGAASSRDFAERAQSMFGRYKGIFEQIGAKMKDIKGYPVKSTMGLGVGGPQCQDTQKVQQQGGPQSPPSIGGALGGALGGMFGGKKKAEPAPEPTTPPTTMPGGLISLMSLTTELVSVSRDAIPPATFELPPGLKKVKD
jgi:hypothetical protein